MNIAVIPARGGSKRIPRKNIKLFCGDPILKIVIKLAIASGCFDRVIVSTDDYEIKKIATEAGAEVPFMRDIKLASDFAPTVDVISDLISKLISTGDRIDNVCCLYPTSVFINSIILNKGLRLLDLNRPSYVISISSYSHPIQRALKINDCGMVNLINSNEGETRTQDTITNYFDAGQFYWGRFDTWLSKKPLLNSDALPIILSAHSFQDIDTPEQWIIAEQIYKLSKEGSVNHA